MATTPPKDDEKNATAPTPPDATPTEATGEPPLDLTTAIPWSPFRYTAEMAARTSYRLEQLDTLPWFTDLDAWQQAKVKQVLASDALTQEDQLYYTLAALLTGMQLYIEALQQLPESLA